VAPVVASIVKEGLNLKYHWGVGITCSARRATSPPRPTWTRPTPWQGRGGTGREGPQLGDADRGACLEQAYKWKVGVAELSKVANVEKMMPTDFITADGFGITAKCRQYLEPLIKGEDYPRIRMACRSMCA